MELVAAMSYERGEQVLNRAPHNIHSNQIILYQVFNQYSNLGSSELFSFYGFTHSLNMFSSARYLSLRNYTSTAHTVVQA